MADLPLPLLREPLIDRRTLLVSRSWVPWFELWFGQLNTSVQAVQGSTNIDLAWQTDVQALREVVALVQELQAGGTLQANIQTLRDLGAMVETFQAEGAPFANIRTLLDTLNKALTTDSEGIALDSQRLNGTPGSYYVRFSLATS